MITAHLPSGYALGATARHMGPWVMPAAVVGGVFPDLDLIWFYFIDDRAFHHHRYWVHAPAFWLVVGAVGLPLISKFWHAALRPALAFLAAVFLHICLDAIAGDIMWKWPVDTQLFSLIEIPARYDNWILNFILHPVFLLELLIWAAAATIFVRNRA